MFSEVEHTRISISKATDPKKKSELGQFLTPAPIAQFMAKLFVRGTYDDCRLLDAGAGIGSLCAVFLDGWVSNGFNFPSVAVDAFEIDQTLQPYLTQTLAQYKTYPGLSATIRTIDFVYAAADHLSGNLFAETLPKYTHAILNPPYKKIHSNSAYRSVLRQAGIEAVNLYSAFVTLSLSLLENHGQLVAIIPRSFCNGPYYRPFRNFILGQTAIKHIHLFASRDKAFKDDKVLQENLIILLERGGQQGPVLISTSTDESFADLTTQEYPFDRIVLPNDPEQFIHVPTSYVINTLESCPAVRYSLSDLGVEVSTGPVVDFRVKEYLRAKPDADTVPLLYPGHFNRNGNKRSKHTPKKPVAIQRNSETEKWLYP